MSADKQISPAELRTLALILRLWDRLDAPVRAELAGWLYNLAKSVKRWETPKYERTWRRKQSGTRPKPGQPMIPLIALHKD